MEKLGLIKENKSSNLRTLSNFVVIDKQRRSTKADQAIQRKEIKEGKAIETPQVNLSRKLNPGIG